MPTSAEWASDAVRVFTPLGQLWLSRLIESFNGKLCNGYFSINQFYSLGHDKDIIGLWKEECSTVRPPSFLGNKTPFVYPGQ